MLNENTWFSGDDSIIYVEMKIAHFLMMIFLIFWSLSYASCILRSEGRINDSWSQKTLHFLRIVLFGSFIKSSFTSFWCLLFTYRFWVVNCISQQSCHLIPGNIYPIKLPLLVRSTIHVMLHSKLRLSLVSNVTWCNVSFISYIFLLLCTCLFASCVYVFICLFCVLTYFCYGSYY